MPTRPSHAKRPAGAARRSRRPERFRNAPRFGRAARSRRPARRNRRRGAPRSLVVRRLLAVLLAGCAVLLALRPGTAAPAAGAARVEEQPAGIPLVLPLADSATASVLEAGQKVDLYAANGDSPPALTLTGVPLVDIQISESALTSPTSTGESGAYIVVHVMPSPGLIESLLAATSIVATVSAVDSD